MSFQSLPMQILLASAVNNMGTSLFSIPGNITNATGYCIQAAWSNGSTPVGTITLQASNDSMIWTDIDDISLTVSGNSGSDLFNSGPGKYYNFIRVVYTRTSGDGILLIQMSSKG